MAKKAEATIDKTDISVEEKLKALFELQQFDSNIDRIRIVRGELPIEVGDLEDEIEGLDTRIANQNEEIKQIEDQIAGKKLAMKEAQSMIKKYQAQQNNVKNNREYESLNKEIEFQTLEIQLAEKRIKEYAAQLTSKNSFIEDSEAQLKDKKKELKEKKSELDSIIEETEKEEDQLIKKSKKAASIIEDRLIIAYQKLRGNARNGLAVVTIQRDSCGGCFNKIPAQRQLDIKQRRKIIVCEHCGRILVDSEIAGVTE